MDPSALIFVALAVAWTAYLLPLALKHHDDASRSRTVEGFSHRLRVLARREPVDKKRARLTRPGQAAAAAETTTEVRTEVKIRSKVRVPARPAAPATPAAPAAAAPAGPAAPVELAPAQLRARREAAKRATRRRRNVLALLLVATLAVVGVAAFSLISWWYVAIPVGLLAAWLVACRVMVKGEQQALAPVRATAPTSAPAAKAAATPATEPAAEAPAVAEFDGFDPMADTSAGIAAVVDPAVWDPVPVTLPTYVGKPAATRRTVRTIDLDSTGVWTSGRTEADAQLAREADEADKAARKARRDGDDQRAVGS